MEITKYSKEEMGKYLEDLKYWCNGCGELHRHGKYSIKEEDLPMELRRAYNDLWTDGNGSYCYIVEYKGAYGIALINEFDKEFAKDINKTMDELWRRMQAKAEEFQDIEEFETAQIILAENSGFEDGHEFVVFLPWNTGKALFDRVADILYRRVYAKPNGETNRYSYGTPQFLRTVADCICKRFCISGICDPMYICNTIALESGTGDGIGNFTAEKFPENTDYVKIARTLYSAYGCNIGFSEITELAEIIRTKTINYPVARERLLLFIKERKHERAKCDEWRKDYLTRVINEATETLEEFKRCS